METCHKTWSLHYIKLIRMRSKKGYSFACSNTSRYTYLSLMGTQGQFQNPCAASAGLSS